MAALSPTPLTSPSISDREYQELYQRCYSLYIDEPGSQKPPDFSCKMSTLLYSLFYLLWDKHRVEGRLDVNAFIQDVTRIINLERTIYMTSPMLSSIFLDNRIVGDVAVLLGDHYSTKKNPKEKDYHLILSDMDSLFLKYPMTIFGLVFSSRKNGTLAHYFIVRKERGQFFLVSSYSSPLISIFQYETPLNMEEFYEYIFKLSLPRKNAEVVNGFMKK